MFDEVHTDIELPAPSGLPAARLAQFHSEVVTLGFQTKDFECVMDRYVVTKDGRLLRQSRSWDSREVLEEEFLDFHGRFEMHTMFFADDAGLVEHDGLKVRVMGPTFKGEAYAISYVIKFTDGHLVAVEHPTAKRI